MFHLENIDQKAFFEEHKKELIEEDDDDNDDEQRQLIEAYQRSVHQARHVELQVLHWQNARYEEAMAAGQGLQQWTGSFIADDDFKSKYEQTKQYLADLTTHQNALNEQIETLMSLKQPVQSETTYLLKSVQDSSQAYNVTVLPAGPLPPKLTYQQFCQRLYGQEQDTLRVEHQVKRETSQMAEGLLSLQRSIRGVTQSVEEAEKAAHYQEKSENIRQLIQRINKLDRLAFMTVLEHGSLKKRLLKIEKQRTLETTHMRNQYEHVESRKKQLQVRMIYLLTLCIVYLSCVAV
jgi:hypothetical protein